MSSSSSPPPGQVPPQPTAWWDQLAERRLDEVTRRLTEVANNLSEVSKEMRSQNSVTDKQGWALLRLEERLKEAETEIRELPKKLERLVTVEWMQRLDTRLTSVEDESKSPFVRKLEFEPVRKAVFTLIGAICLAVLGAVAKLVMK